MTAVKSYAKPLRQWVKLEKYCETTGDTRDAVYARRKTGKWIDGIHTVMVERRLWVCLNEVNQWILNQQNNAVMQRR